MRRERLNSVDAYLALGSNLGDREATIRSAIKAIDSIPHVRIIKSSSLHETEPVGPSGQARYINAAVMVRTSLTPRNLLEACLNIERVHGRTRSDRKRWDSRTLDIDLLLFGDQVIDDPGPPRLRVPHAHMAERSFVLQPLVEIAPQVRHPPFNKTIEALCNELTHAEYKRGQACFP